MPAFTVTAVDTTNNTLTATGVAAAGGTVGLVLTTGDRLRLRNVGGALPAATPALAAVTDYFAIRVDDNTIKVADTNAHALAGTAIDITGSGSGTTTIEFNLPYCVPRVAAQGSLVFYRDDNAAWQALVALYDLLTGQTQSIWSTIVVAVTVAFNAAVTFLQDLTLASGKNLVLQGSGAVKHGTWTKILSVAANANGNTFITIDSSTIFGWDVMLDQHFQSGDVITAIRINCTDNATGPTRANCKFRRYTDGSGTPADIAGPTATSGTAGTLQQVSFTGLSETIAAGKTHVVQVLPTGGTAAIVWWSVEIDWTR